MRNPVSPIEPFHLERYFARWEFNAPYLLCTSDIQGYPLNELLALADDDTLKLWNNLTLGYTETTGHPLLRQEIAGLYQQTSADQILCFAGAEEAIYIAMRVLLRSGDHIIVTFPGYQSSYQVAETIGAQVSRWSLRLENGTWTLNPDDLRSLIRPNTRLVLVNFPHNPTGYLPAQEEWSAIQDIAAEAGVYLFADEVYRMLEYESAARLNAAVDYGYDRALSLGVMSKPFGLAGLRIGWLALHDRDLYKEIASYKDYTTICNSAPSEVLALIALRRKGAVLERGMRILRGNLARVEECLAGLAGYFDWIPPRAGSIAFPRWLGPGGVVDFIERLVQKTGVLLLPGTVYDFPGEHFRLGLGRENTFEALSRLEDFIRKAF